METRIGGCLLLLTLPVLVTVPRAEAAVLSNLQSGTATSTANGTLTVAIQNVDPTKSFLVFQTRSNSNRPVGSMLRGRIASATTLEFVRVTDEATPVTINIQWFVASFASGVTVQRGETTQSATAVDVPITAVGATDRAFVTWSKTPVATDTTFGDNDAILGELTSTTNLQFRCVTATAGHVIWWQVVEFTKAGDVRVQRGNVSSMTGTTSSATATLSPAVDVERTFVLAGYKVTGSATAVGAGMIRARLTNSTTITFDRAVTGAANVSAANTWTTGLTHTAGAGSNRLLLFAVGYEHGSDTGITSVSYGGQALTRIAGVVAGVGAGGSVNRVELWYLLEGGIAAASDTTFGVTWTGGAPTDPMYAAVTYQNVGQTTPIAASSTNFTNDPTPNPITTNVTVAARGLSVAGAINGNDGSYTWNNGWTEGTDQASGTTTTMSTGGLLATVDGTATASATHTGQNRAAIVAAALNPVTPNDIPEISWQAVELMDGSTVENGSASFANTVGQAVVALAKSVDLSRSVAVASVQATGGQNQGRTSYTSDDVVGTGAATLGLTSTTLTLDRGSATGAADIGYAVIQFKQRRVIVVQ